MKQSLNLPNEHLIVIMEVFLPFFFGQSAPISVMNTFPKMTEVQLGTSRRGIADHSGYQLSSLLGQAHHRSMTTFYRFDVDSHTSRLDML